MMVISLIVMVYLLENSWYQMGNNWYYINGSGKYLTNQWSQINGKWYVFDGYGRMLANVWKGDYYLKSSGAMADKEWVYDQNYSSWFYLKAGGRYAKKTMDLVPTILNLVDTWPIRNGFMTQTIKLGTILRTMVCMSQEPMQWMEKPALPRKWKMGS